MSRRRRSRRRNRNGGSGRGKAHLDRMPRIGSFLPVLTESGRGWRDCENRSELASDHLMLLSERMYTLFLRFSVGESRPGREEVCTAMVIDGQLSGIGSGI